MIIDKTIDLVQNLLDDKKIPTPEISNAVLGLGYTGVELEFRGSNNEIGVAYTLPELFKNGSCTKINFAGVLTDRAVQELLNWGKNPLSLERIIGIATLNALSQFYIHNYRTQYTFLTEDLFHYFNLNEDTKVTFIGLIKPMIKKMAQTTKNIVIIEKNLEFSGEFKDFTLRRNINNLDQEELDTDILICTGTSLINNTLEHILEAFENKAKFKCFIGPSASMIPDILFEEGIDLVGGMKFENSAKTFKVLQEAGGTKFFKKYAQKYNIIKQS
ncbi:MAG: hypothetical protein BAJALOKI3v1_130060 [Promethearchaeota archaeon]|jgi:uncharacterized protein (DUF4213/DUF364 family)|nr:MAG: hypothetical protein BAJALOKI3v1_130060 [Candidatus Lokiarchaeota archaeon]